MLINLKQPINCIQQTRYEYRKNHKLTAHLEDKHINGYFIPELNVWLHEDIFNNVFSVING